MILRCDGDGITMHGTPWHGDADSAAPRSAPLTRLFLLRQAPRHALVSLTPASAAALLFSCTFPVFHDRDALDRTLALLATVVEKVPVDALEFAPAPDVIDFVRREVRDDGRAAPAARARREVAARERAGVGPREH